MTRGDLARAAAALSLASVAALAGAPAARAQSAEAEVLFRDGRRLIQAGKLAEGCDKLEASERLESSVGALLNLGDCREKLGELASAWAAFRKAEAKAKHAGNDEKRRAEARRRWGLIEPKLLYLVVSVEQPAPGLVVRRDGEPVDGELWGAAVPIDPGTYELVAEAPGHRPWRTQVTIALPPRSSSSAPIAPHLRRRAVAVPALEPAPPLPPPPITAPAAGEPSAIHARVSPGRGTWSTRRKMSAVAAVAGAGALGAGAYFGWRANDLAERSNRRCPLVTCGDGEALRLNADARTAAATANVLYVAGGAAAVTAAILWLTGKPRDTAIQPGVAGGVGVSISGRF